MSQVWDYINKQYIEKVGTYYLRFTAVSALSGVYTLRWEEHP